MIALCMVEIKHREHIGMEVIAEMKEKIAALPLGAAAVERDHRHRGVVLRQMCRSVGFCRIFSIRD